MTAPDTARPSPPQGTGPMGDRPNVYAENLLGAARCYGDAKLAAERNSHALDTPEWNAVVRTCREAEGNLHRAARAYATRMRRRASKAC